MGLFDGFKKRKKDYKEVAADNTKLSERDMLINKIGSDKIQYICCLLYTSPSPRD